MAKDAVVIKSFKNGFNIVLDDQAPLEDLVRELGDKFQRNAAFFGNANSAISFSGRKLTDEEEDELIEAITSSSNVRISCVVVKDDDRNSLYLRAMKEFAQASDAAKGQVYVGTLQSGEKLESPYALTVIGDVNPGATVISGGSITVIGTLYGEAIAGNVMYDDEDEEPDEELVDTTYPKVNFVAAFDVKALATVVINDVVINVTQKDLGNSLIKKNSARIFYEKDGRVLMEGISKDFIENCRSRLL